MSKNSEHHDTYIIPPNFIEGSTLFGGMFKIRNVIEAGVLAAAVGVPVFSLDLSLTVRIIILCLTALPLALFALMGVAGEPISSYIVAFFKWLKNRRVVGKTEPKEVRKKPKPKKEKQPASENESMLSEIAGVIRKRSAKKKHTEEPRAAKTPKREKPHRRSKADSLFLNPVAEYLPIEKIANGIIYTKDHRYIKLIEVVPINFLLRSAREQRSIIYSFISYLKISPVRIQFKVLTKRADLNKHTEIVRREMEAETDPNCRSLQEDYLKLINRIGSREATTRRFFVAFEYEQVGRRGSNEEADAIASLQTTARTAANYLKQCGNEVLTPENEDEFTVDVLYNILCRQESSDIPLPQRVQDVLSSYIAAGKDTDAIPCTEFFAPRTLDFTHAKYICVDGQYRSYLLIPSYGYKSQVAAGWLSLLVNAGDGIDIDLFLTRQPKERMVNKLGQQLRINRSKIREASDTNSDFDDLDGAIRSGYFLKEGLSNNEDFYYMNILITMTADNAEDLEWREREMRKLLISQDLNIVPCSFREEQGFLSSLPLTNPEKHLYERSKRNVLTSGAASCYPFTAYELSDDNGILLGVNKYNNSLVIVDIFNSAVYKNANIAIMGTSGAGKTFTLQLMALRMRRKGTQVFIIAPLKGHEFLRACRNTGGEFIQISPASKNCINVMEIDENGLAVFTADVPAGAKLYVKEVATDAHYLLSDAVYPVAFDYEDVSVAFVQLVINNGEVIENTIIRGSIHGLKVDEDNTPVAGAVFGLFKANETEFTEENALATATPGEDGVFTFENIPYGDWIVRELSCPAHLVLSEESYKVTVSEKDQIIEITVVNKFLTGKVQVRKVSSKDHDKLLSGAEFVLYLDVNGNKAYDPDIDTLYGELSEADTGVYELSGLKHGGYLLLETKAPDGFTKDDRYFYFRIQKDGETVIVENEIGVGFTNEPIPTPTPEYPDSPKTGDDSKLWLWILLASGSLTVLITVGMASGKKRKAL